MLDYKKMENESYKDFCIRIYRNQKLWDLKNDVVGFIINQEYPDFKKDESAHRKKFKERIEAFDEGYEKALKDMEDKEPAFVTQGEGLDSLKPKTHLDKMQEMLGEYTIRKRDMQLERNSLAHLMREATPSILMVEKFEELLLSGKVELPRLSEKTIEKSIGGHLKVITSDMHIGMVIDEDYNKYNYKILRRRLQEHANKAIEKAKSYNVSDISIIDMGDMVESIFLRGNQAYDCEFTESEQIVYAQQAYLEFLQYFTDEGYDISVSFIRGNHDRLDGLKTSAIDHDSATFIIAENLKLLYQQLEAFTGIKSKVTFTNTNDYYTEHHEEILGKNIKYVHGDNTSAGDKQKMNKYSGVDNIVYDYLFLGHLHRFSMFQGNRNEVEVYNASIMGGNEYGCHKIKSTSSAGATLALFLENGDVIIDNVNLQDA